MKNQIKIKKSLLLSMQKKHHLLFALCILSTFLSKAQQDPQYTQYMYNTQVVNPAYAGSRDMLSIGLLGRTQWVGFEGSPKTGTFTINSPIGLYDNMGLGLSIVHDQIGPAIESNVVIDYSYSIEVSQTGKLAFGVKGGVDILDVDYTKLNIYNQNDPFFQNNIDNKLQPQIGVGLYYNTEKFYTGLSVPNLLNSKHFDESALQNIENSVAVERLHYFLIAGYVFDLNNNLKFKPATLVKAVSGSPLQWDLSANFLINEKFTLGTSYRWNASLSALAGFQISNSIFIGMAYDYESTSIENYSDGSYEVFLRFDIFNKTDRVITPRFF
tara:strand:- start:12488 stop:13468 length:981 start_codon:yes stop_codon:yes gene_type:complete